MITILGIDPGLAATGIGVVRGRGVEVAHFAYGTIRTAPGLPLEARLDEIYGRLGALLSQEVPDQMVLEDVFSLAKYPKSGIQLGQVTGVIRLAGYQAGVPVCEVAVREAKKVLTGNGNAGKRQLERAVRHLLKIDCPITPFHASDALGLALIGLYRWCGPANRREACRDDRIP
jgi:crossover junction endodeoxyribonuclease RuvC